LQQSRRADSNDNAGLLREARGAEKRRCQMVSNCLSHLTLTRNVESSRRVSDMCLIKLPIKTMVLNMPKGKPKKIIGRKKFHLTFTIFFFFEGLFQALKIDS
jgi:hypothetical protein